MTPEIKDHTGDTVGSQEFSADDIAGLLNVTKRTVYRMVEREGWEKIEGFQGRVYYRVPNGFLENYLAMAQKDQRPISAVSPTVPNILPMVSEGRPMPSMESVTDKETTQSTSVNDVLVSLLIQEKDNHINELKSKITESEALIRGLRHQLIEAEKRVSRLEGEMTTIDNERTAWSEALAASKQSVNAIQGAYLNLQTQFHELQEKQRPALTASASNEASSPKKGFWSRFIGS